MKRYDWSTLNAAEKQSVLARPSHRASAEVATFVRTLFDEVAAEGAPAVERWALKIDGVAPSALEISPDVLAAARAALEAADIEAIEFAVDQVRFYHEATKPKAHTVETMPGVRSTLTWRAIERCGLYVPNGTAPLISTLIMLAEPARVAGVRERIVVSPPGSAPHPALIVAAAACGLERVWRIGGAQAIAALIFGAGVPRADKLFGPGNVYVAEAKRYAATLPNGPAIDLPAGPSELLVIADATANPTLIAADLLSQAEHDADAQVILVSTSDEMIAAVLNELETQSATLPRRSVVEKSLAQGRCVKARDLDEAVEIANLYAPEHLALQVAAPERVTSGIENAGAVFIGAYSAETFGDYVAGPSHVLPTDQAARLHSGVSVASFMKSCAIENISAEGVARLARPAARLARLEGLEAHARAADIRERLINAASASAPADDITRRRFGAVTRHTRETKIDVSVDLDRTDRVAVNTGLGFYDHMLEQVAQHGGFSLNLLCDGDLHIDSHHTIEDCALAFGAALKQALGDKRGIARYGFVLPMDEAEAQISLDLGGRPYLVFEGAFEADAIGAYPTEMTEHVFRSLSQALGAAIHLSVRGDNDHHKTEACFKAFGRAMRQAVRVEGADVPSTKGVI